MNSIIPIILILLLISGCIADKKTSDDDKQEKNSSLISRDQLFGNPDRVTVRISPDGNQLSFLAPLNGVMNVWVGPSAQPNLAKPVTNDTYRGIRNYGWAYTNQHIIYCRIGMETRTGEYTA